MLSASSGMLEISQRMLLTCFRRGANIFKAKLELCTSSSINSPVGAITHVVWVPVWCDGGSTPYTLQCILYEGWKRYQFYIKKMKTKKTHLRGSVGEPL